jgi:MSHA pilin protein MshB
MYYIQKQHGFTLVELITVIFVVGLLSVVAIPRFIDVQDRADLAAIEGVAGGLASGVSLVRAQWEVLGKPDENPVLVPYGSASIGVDPLSGFPSSGSDATSTGTDNLSDQTCTDIFNTVLHNAPSITPSYQKNDLKNSRYYSFYFSETGEPDINLCIYASTRGFREQTFASAGDVDTKALEANRITYDPSTGDVELILED